MNTDVHPSTHDLIRDADVFAPVNIAWIKYMGKSRVKVNQPTNSSFSMTLDSLGTYTSIRKVKEGMGLEFEFSKAGYVPDAIGVEKVNQFLKSQQTAIVELLKKFGFSALPLLGTFEITTVNTVPAGTGIATSASGFAALTLAFTKILLGKEFERFKSSYFNLIELKRGLAQISKMGSGSSCRSFFGPFCEWNAEGGVDPVDTGLDYVDLLILISEKEKEVSSSEAHLRVLSSPKFKRRSELVGRRLSALKTHIKSKALKEIAELVLEEAIEMHTLFETAIPPFSYLNDESRFWIEAIQKRKLNPPTSHAALTFDAGANAHFFVPLAEKQEWLRWIYSLNPNAKVIEAVAGLGARFL